MFLYSSIQTSAARRVFLKKTNKIRRMLSRIILLLEDISRSARECVRVLFSEDMSDSATGHYFEIASALPNAEWHLEVLPAPYVHVHVIGSKSFEPFLADGEQTSCHRGGSKVVHTSYRRTPKALDLLYFSTQNSNFQLQKKNAKFTRAIIELIKGLD